MALATNACETALAQLPLPCTPSSSQSTCETDGLLPYPFPKLPSAGESASCKQLISLIGLARRGVPQPVQLPAAGQQIELPSIALPNPTVGDQLNPVQQIASSSVGTPNPNLALPAVVQASATEIETAVPSAIPTAQTESLLDIEIPLTLDLDQQTSAAESAALPQPSVSLPAVSGTREPVIMPDARSMRISVASPGQTEAKPADHAEVRMSLSDAPEASTAPAHPSRAASLHLSSASQAAPQTVVATPQASAPRVPKQGMQVRVEGEPVPLIKAANLTKAALAVEAPKATFEKTTSAPSTPLVSVNTGLRSTVKATFASRTTPLQEQNTAPTNSPPADAGVQVGQPMSVELQGTIPVATEFSISELSVEHPSVCQLLKTGDRTATLIGMRPGSTRIAIITRNGQGEQSVDVREVSVSGGTVASEVALPQLAKDISRTVAKLYPNSDVQIVVYQESLLVRGFTNYESDAKKILSLVRKTSLAPVIDQLVTNGN